MDAQYFIVATAGHVDHGKSALVKALTGADPDRLPEEKARGITIDLGFAHLELPAPAAGGAAPLTLSVGLVDVPGHEDFVKNMVAGVGSIDLALLVVAADDGWMPQTEEHLQILSYLGVSRAVIALTKVDLSAGNMAAATTAVRARLQGTLLAEAPLVATSVVTGQGLGELKAVLARRLAQIPPRPDLGQPRLPVDRVFTLPGIGTVVTGTLSGGVLRRGEAVRIQPSGREARIRNLQTYHRDAARAGPGTRVALNLPDVTLGNNTLDNCAVRRGDVITLPACGGPAEVVDVLLEKSGRLAGAHGPAAQPLKHGVRARIHHGSGNIPARVLLWEGNALAPGGRALARLRLESPVLFFGGDRLIVRDWSEQHTLAGGTVLDPEATGERFRDPAQLRLLEQRSRAPADAAVWVASLLARDRAAPRARWAVKSGFGPPAIESAVEQLMARKVARTAGPWIVDAGWWRAGCEQAAQLIRTDHQLHPERPGLPLQELREKLGPELGGAELFPALLAELSQAGFAQVGAAVRHESHRPALPPAWQAAGARLGAALAAKPFEPPPRKELERISQPALKFLLTTGEAVEISEDTVMLAGHFTRAVEIIRQYLRSHGSATASELRQALGTSRRVIIPLLERLDRDGVTVRLGDRRKLRVES
jgi:selenocysteine-specific elongation factor